MDDLFARFAANLGDRVTGPMRFRLVLQPAVASLFAIRAGLAEARARRIAPVQDSSTRTRLATAWRDVGRVILVALALDLTYQLVVLRFVYPGELLVVAAALALVPYLVVRGVTARLAR
jgi:hypothetical protein